MSSRTVLYRTSIELGYGCTLICVFFEEVTFRGRLLAIRKDGLSGLSENGCAVKRQPFGGSLEG